MLRLSPSNWSTGSNAVKFSVRYDALTVSYDSARLTGSGSVSSSTSVSESGNLGLANVNMSAFNGLSTGTVEILFSAPVSGGRFSVSFNSLTVNSVAPSDLSTFYVVTGSSAGDLIQGDSLAEYLFGLAGADTLDGGVGNDTLAGGLGDDLYLLGAAEDVVMEAASQGIDTVRAGFDYVLGANVENLELTGSGDRVGTGNGLANRITGTVGNDLLDGHAGNDTLAGGAGDDIYIADSSTDVVIESAGEGVDTIRSSTGYTLSANVEILELVGSAHSNGTGNALGNLLLGTAGDNVLDGAAGNDTMLGGMGNDSYGVDSTADVVTEFAGEGTDTVLASITWTLADTLENITLVGKGNINANGNALGNVLVGNGSNNLLNGAGGADTMSGGSGNDTYTVDNTGDSITEGAGAGIDTVRSNLTHTLGANVEHLVLLGKGNRNGVGNEQDNQITGNTGANALDGKGGADTMSGGLGNDIYFVDNAADVVRENAGEGIDQVRAGVSHVLGANIENLQLNGSANRDGTGNELDNVLLGNSGNNLLDGRAGADTLTGGAGDDRFVLGNTIGSDTITDFVSGSDKLVLAGQGLGIGDGDNTLSGAVTVAGPGGFAITDEYVLVTGGIAGPINPDSAAAAIGSAGSSYAVGQKVLFMVDNGSNSALYLFQALDADAAVEAGELTLLALLQGTAGTTTGDLVFGA